MINKENVINRDHLNNKYNKTTNKTDALARPNDASIGRNGGTKCQRGTDGAETHNRITYLQHHLVGRDDDVCTYVMLPATEAQKAGRRGGRGAGGHRPTGAAILSEIT